MKLIYASIAALILTSCSKEDRIETISTHQKVYMRIQVIEPVGDTTYSNIVLVNIK